MCYMAGISKKWCCIFMVLSVGISCVLSAEASSTTASNSTDPGPRCKTLFTFGYGYRQFFHMSRDSFHLSKSGDLLFMRFQVKARSDAHILLSPSPSPEESDPVYEIVLGAGKNSFSDIRRKRRAATRASAATKDIISGTELKKFWIRMNSEGLIMVGSEGEDLPVMQWQDPEPLDIQYFSFCTWSGVAGKWLYDCVTEESAAANSESEAVAPVLSANQRLRKALLTDYDVFVRPSANSSELLEVSVSLQTNHVQLDAKKSVMTVGCELTLEWVDEKMMWDTENFDGVELLNLNHHEIWRPELIHFNGVGKALLLQGREGEGMRVMSDGRVRWRTSNLLQSRCQMNLRDWPWDTQVCDLQLGFWHNMRLGLLLQVNSTKLQVQKTGSQWEVRQLISESVILRKPWLVDATAYESDSDDTDDLPPSALTFTITLRRTNTGIYYVFVIPLLVMIAMSLSCFWMAPLSVEKLSTNCLLLLLLCAFLLSLDSSLPGPVIHTPFLVKVYSLVLTVVLGGTVVNVAVSTLSTPMSPYNFPPRILCRALTSQFVSTVFFFSVPKVKDGNLRRTRRKTTDCLSLVAEGQEEDEEESGAFKDRAAEAMFYWNLLALFTDRIAFASALIAYTLVFVY